MQLMIYRPL